MMFTFHLEAEFTCLYLGGAQSSSGFLCLDEQNLEDLVSFYRLLEVLTGFCELKDVKREAKTSFGIFI